MINVMPVLAANAFLFENERKTNMYDEVIKKLLKKLDIIPEPLLVLYLMKVYKLSENMAHQSVYAACRNRTCYRVNGDNIARMSFIEMNSNYMKLAKAFRVLLEFMPSTQNFVVASYPWLLAFSNGKNFVQICYIERDMELVSSMVIAEKPVPKEDRASMKRIAIIDAGCEVSKVKAAGFAYFCTVSDNYQLNIVAKADPMKAWNDVPEKA